MWKLRFNGKDVSQKNTMYYPIRDLLLEKYFDLTNNVIDLSYQDDANILCYVVKEQFIKKLFDDFKREMEKIMVGQLKDKIENACTLVEIVRKKLSRK